MNEPQATCESAAQCPPTEYAHPYLIRLALLLLLFAGFQLYRDVLLKGFPSDPCRLIFPASCDIGCTVCADGFRGHFVSHFKERLPSAAVP